MEGSRDFLSVTGISLQEEQEKIEEQENREEQEEQEEQEPDVGLKPSVLTCVATLPGGLCPQCAALSLTRLTRASASPSSSPSLPASLSSTSIVRSMDGVAPPLPGLLRSSSSRTAPQHLRHWTRHRTLSLLGCEASVQTSWGRASPRTETRWTTAPTWRTAS